MFVKKLATGPYPALSGTYSARAFRKWVCDRHPIAKLVPGQHAWRLLWVLGYLFLHLPLALLMREVRWLAGIHALGTFVIGLWLCARRPRPCLVIQWIGYVVGAEVLWRMCHAPIPWQFAEYIICFVCVVLLLRSGARRRPLLPLLYCGLLLPASFIPFTTLSLDEARQAVSFNLSGPLCLALCALWYASRPLSVAAFERLGVTLLGPIGGVAFLGLFGLATAENEFSHNANFVASGGYGPNQVSALVGLGALLAVVLYLSENRSHLLRIALAALALGLLALSALTFSRTGLYLFGASFGVATFFLFQAQGRALRLLLLLAVLTTVACASLPILNGFTGGKLVERFCDTGLTGRDTIAKMEVQIWQEHPVLGAGAGMSEYLRGRMGDPRPAHTEYTRLLAEHGLLGIGACVVLLIMTTRAFFRARGPWAKAMVSALAVWAFLFMAASAMRLAAPAFLLGLVQARFLAVNAARIRPARPIRRFHQPQPAYAFHEPQGRGLFKASPPSPQPSPPARGSSSFRVLAYRQRLVGAGSRVQSANYSGNSLRGRFAVTRRFRSTTQFVK